MQVVVTGAGGFIGRRIAPRLRQQGHTVVEITTKEPRALLAAAAAADAVVHLAGVNRPTDPADFERVNAGLTAELAGALDMSRSPVLVFASSTQAELDNPYGRSKRRGEEALESAAARGARVALFRLPNVFGPGGRPNYNSAVATFAHNAARGLPLQVNDPARELTLVYVHDVARAMCDAVAHPPAPGRAERRTVTPEYHATVGGLAETFTGYAASRGNNRVPDVAGPLARRLYATFLAALAPDGFAYDLTRHTDDRGALAEFLKSGTDGQIFVSRTRPGITRGNHFHHTKTEKFLVLEGDAVVRFRKVDGAEVLSYPVSGRDFRVVDIPPDHTHSIENVGSSELIVLFWASEIFDPKDPDTTPLNVLA